MFYNICQPAFTQRIKTGDTSINVQVEGDTAYVSHAKDDYIGTINLKDFSAAKTLKAFGTNGMIVVR